ncbi:MAG TPA: outer membrane beta-barrel protein [Acidobacteriaceae bacterium]|nr:outer membrane beta-barrel protein [Acidobacteriaceae bacterium]
MRYLQALGNRRATYRKRAAALLIGFFMLLAPTAWANDPPDKSQTKTQAQQIDELRSMVLRLQDRVDGLERQLNERRNPEAAPGSSAQSDSASLSSQGPSALSSDASELAANLPLRPAPAQPMLPAPASQPQPQSQASASPLASVLPATLPGGATLNYTLDGYYEFNFNQPPGRVNYVRAYDVLSNVFSINQADVVLALDPDVSKNRRYGLRLDLQFGQATDTLQGNPANEPRPQIYQNIFQAYGTYIVPLGSGLNIDVGKWASSLGAEGNYTKDQMNYTRSFYFYFLPFYHQGGRASYKFNDKIQANYWLVNGTNQSEPTNGYKDEMFGFVLTPTKTITWTSNYYLGQEHPDSTPANNCTVPVQPGLCESPITPAPNGKLHIFDDYINWQATPKLTLIAEGDYVIQREWANAAPGHSSAPSHVDGGAAYIQYQLTPKASLATRGEYMSDPQGLFSGKSQALKEWTGTWKYNFGEGFDAFLEYRTDWTNQPYFLTHNPGAAVQHQTTATLGLVWWYGGKQGTW